MSDEKIPKSIKRTKVKVSVYARPAVVRLYPSVAQAKMLRRAMGASRKIWNLALASCQEPSKLGRPGPSFGELCQSLTLLKRAPETSWLGEIPTDVLQQTLRHLCDAFARHRVGLAKAPRFKRFGTVSGLSFVHADRRVDKDPDDTTHPRIDLERRRITLTGMGEIRYRCSSARQPVGDIAMASVRVDPAGRWYASVVDRAANPPTVRPPRRAAVGIDLGMRSAATFDDGTQIAPRKPMATKRARLRRYQRGYARQRTAACVRQGIDPSAKRLPKGTHLEGSKRMLRRQRQMGRLHAVIADQRKDATHQLSRRIVDEAQVIGLENLSVRGMAKSLRRSFRRSLHDVALGELKRQILYKAAWSGRQVIQVDRFFPSSQLCSTVSCDYRHRDLQLSDRRWTCPQCGSDHDRDHNAAINIQTEALRLLGETSTARSGVKCSPGDGNITAGIDARGESCAVDMTEHNPSRQHRRSKNRELPFSAVRRNLREARTERADTEGG